MAKQFNNKLFCIGDAFADPQRVTLALLTPKLHSGGEEEGVSVDCFGITHYPRRFHWSENQRFKTIFNTVPDGTKRFIWEAGNIGGRDK